jgi:hypothetical protein
MEIEMLPEIYQTILVNFGYDVYTGRSLEEARAAAVKAGFESVILLDGAHVASYSPIGGWK